VKRVPKSQERVIVARQDNAFRIAVMPGDGIGREVMDPCLDLLERVERKVGGFALKYETLEAGADHYRQTGTALPKETLARASEADAILLGAMGLPDVRYPDGREVGPQLDLREEFQLFAGIRPVRTFPGLPVPLSDPRALALDFVLIRESTEGLFSSRGKTEFVDGTARDFLEISRSASERLFDFSFELARRRSENGYAGKVTCVDKSNVLGSFAFFREIFFERAGGFPDVDADVCYVDAMALGLIRNPWVNDVVVTENMFGDILSDAGAALMGGMGFAPSADIGADRAVFQPCHGTAPDIVGTGKANPTAMYLSAAMMLDWLGQQNDMNAACDAGAVLEGAVERAFATMTLKPCETGGTDGLKEITRRVIDELG